VSAYRPHRDDFYEFAGFRFYPNRRHQLLRLSDSAEFSLRPQQACLLALLVGKPRGIVTYAEIQEEVWPDDRSGKDFGHDIVSLKSGLAGQFGKLRDEIIETVRGQGYRLNADVVFHPAEGGQLTEISGAGSNESTPAKAASDAPDAALRPHTTLRKHLWHILVSSTLYALLHSIALWVELAYQAERFRGELWAISPAVFFWCAGTACLGMVWGWRSTLRDEGAGLVRMLLVFGAAGVSLYVTLGRVLPGEAVTAAGIQTFTAQAAYLKNIFWFQALAVLYLILPWQEIASREREKRVGGATERAVHRWSSKTKISFLVVLLILALAASALMSYYLFERLQPGAGMNLFMQLVLWRLILSAVLGFEGLAWYARTLRDYE
jgi:DNA-binding winged helix-turn-helix (wHTH) protein